MKCVPAIAWALEGESLEPVDPRLLPLLDAIASSASLTAAVAKCCISYRAGWGLLRDYERKLGTPLAQLERGRGASLSPSGKRLVDAQRKATQRLARILPTLAVEVGTRDERAHSAPATMRIAASHDLALAALVRTLPDGSGLNLDVSFMGSLNALHEFGEGRADVAGFHVPLGRRRGWDRAPFLHALDARRDRLVRFVDRDQGLILPRGNPARVKRFLDVATSGLRFVNRQRGSGTRLLIDQIVADERIDPGSLDGYGTEEFTHAAVAATVASGGADAGFGLRAAAAEYGLAFVPIVRERYFLAVRSKELKSPGLARLIGVLRGAEFARMARTFDGYKVVAAGSVSALDALTATGSARDAESPGTSRGSS